VSETAAPDTPENIGWLGRLKAGLGRSSRSLTAGLDDLLRKRRLDAETLEGLEELLITADLGAAMAAKLSAAIGAERFAQDAAPDEVRARLAEEIAQTLAPVAVPLAVDAGHEPHVVLFVGVNGTGKTTTIGKLARQLRDRARSVTLVAADTFRAAAVAQLQEWGRRADCPVVTGAPGADPAGLAYQALTEARARATDVLLIDTAGRLQNKADLMAELGKIARVLSKIDAAAPHDVVLVLDATTGQNAHSQVELFRRAVPLTGLIVTKLDGSARGGVVVALSDRFALPIHALGVGEGIDDLRPFTAESFARGLLGLDR
jgi:fused signal recognition particle receptor